MRNILEKARITFIAIHNIQRRMVTWWITWIQISLSNHTSKVKSFDECIIYKNYSSNRVIVFLKNKQIIPFYGKVVLTKDHLLKHWWMKEN